jgi:hypothetical protein
VVDAQVGRVLGQSKQIALEGRFLSLRNWAFLSAVGMQTWPLPAAVMFPSAWMLPDMVVNLFILLVVVTTLFYAAAYSYTMIKSRHKSMT